MSKIKDLRTTLKWYKIFSIIGWIALIPSIAALCIKLGIDISGWLSTLIVSIGSVSAFLFFLSFIGKLYNWIVLFKTTLKCNSNKKNILIIYLALSLLIPFIPMFLYKKKIN